MASSRIQQRNRRTQSAKYKGVNDEIAFSPRSGSLYNAQNNRNTTAQQLAKQDRDAARMGNTAAIKRVQQKEVQRAAELETRYANQRASQPTYQPQPAGDLSQYLVNAPQTQTQTTQPQVQDNTFYSAPDKQRIAIEQQLAKTKSEKDRSQSPAMDASPTQRLLYDIEQKNKASWSAATAGKSPEEIQQMTNNYYRQKVDQSQNKRFNRFMSSFSNSYQPRQSQPFIARPQTSQSNIQQRQSAAIRAKAQSNWDKKQKQYGTTKTTRPR